MEKFTVQYMHVYLNFPVKATGFHAALYTSLNKISAELSAYCLIQINRFIAFHIHEKRLNKRVAII